MVYTLKGRKSIFILITQQTVVFLCRNMGKHAQNACYFQQCGTRSPFMKMEEQEKLNEYSYLMNRVPEMRT